MELKKIKAWIWQGIIIIIIFALAFYCGYKKNQPPQSNPIDTVIVVDTVWYAVEVEKPIPYKVIVTDTVYIYDTIKFKVPVPADTSNILADYNRYFVYNDTLNYPDLNLILEEVIYNNRLDYRSVRYQNLRETKIIHNHLRGWYIGADITAMALKPEITYINRDWAYSVGFDVRFNQPNSLSIGLKKKVF